MKKTHFIPTRMRGQLWKIGNVSLAKVGANLLAIVVLAAMILPFIYLNAVAAVAVWVVSVLTASALVWIPNGDISLGQSLYYFIKFQSSFNNYRSQHQASIFDIYEYKQNFRNISKATKVKFRQLRQLDNNWFAIAVKEKQNDNQVDNSTLVQKKILQLNIAKSSKVTYISVFQLVGFNLSFKSEEDQLLTIERLHSALKVIGTAYSLIKIKQPINFETNISQLDESRQVISENPNQDQRDKQNEIMNLLQKRLEGNASENSTVAENNWFLVIQADKWAELDEINSLVAYKFAEAEIEAHQLEKWQISNVFVSLYAPYFSFNDKSLKEQNPEDWNAILNFAGINIDTSVIKVKPMLINERKPSVYLKTSVLNNYPLTDLSLGWLYNLASAFDSFVIHNSTIEQGLAHKLIHQSLENTELLFAKTHNKSKKNQVVGVFDKFEELSKSISAGDEVVYDTLMLGINYSFDTANEAIEGAKQSNALAKTYGFEFSPLQFRQRQGFADIFIKDSIHLKKYQIPMPLYTFSIGFPFMNHLINDHKGIIFGETPTGEPLILDMTKVSSTRQNHNALILGKSGMGKSTLLKLIMLNNFGRGHRIIMIDPEREVENRDMYLNLNGTYIDISQTKINPMIINSYREEEDYYGNSRFYFEVNLKANWLAEFFSIIISLKREHNASKFNLLISELISFYEKQGFTNSTEFIESKQYQFPSVGDFLAHLKRKIEALKTIGNQEYATTLKHFEELYLDLDIAFDYGGKGVVSHIWNTRQSELDITSSMLVCFNVREVQSLGEQIKQAAYALTVDIANKQMWYNKDYNDRQKIINPNHKNKFLFLVFEEAHLFLNEKMIEMTRYLAEIVARARKYSTGLILATQNLENFLVSKESPIYKDLSSLFNNSMYQFYLGMSVNSIEQLNDVLKNIGGLSQQEQNFLAKGIKGEALISVNSKERVQTSIDIGSDLAFARFVPLIKNNKVKIKNL